MEYIDAIRESPILTAQVIATIVAVIIVIIVVVKHQKKDPLRAGFASGYTRNDYTLPDGTASVRCVPA